MSSSVSFAPLIDDMTFSYSRLTSFESCKYKWFMSYIMKVKDKDNMFFSDFGTVCHEILADYYNGKISEDDAYTEYLIRFATGIKGIAPNQKIKNSYFESGMNYFSNIQRLPYNVVGVESKYRFKVGDYNFVGIIDLVCKDDDGNIIIVDHKSHNLKQRSKRKTPTKSDAELDDYLRQLYLYAIPIYKKYGKYPSKLCFNCYRTGTFIEEEFNMDVFESVKLWAIKTIEMIKDEYDWNPSIDFWQCKYLCDYHYDCECYTDGVD